MLLTKQRTFQKGNILGLSRAGTRAYSITSSMRNNEKEQAFRKKSI